MNPKLLLLLTPFAMLGCASKTTDIRASVAPSSAAPPPTVAAAPVESRGFTRPALTKAYYVGSLVDPDHPELMFSRGVVFRREREATWDTTGRSFQTPGVLSGPITSWPNGSEYPYPTDADQEIHAARTDELFNALLEQNAELTAKLSALANKEAETALQESSASPPTIKVRPGSVPLAGSVPSNAAVTVSAPPLPVSGPRPGSSQGEPSVTIAPSADNVIELSPSLLDPPIPGLTNPWRQRYQFKTELVETTIRVEGISLGEEPTCIIGEKLYSVGDQFAVFTVASIDGEGIYLRRDAFLLRIPMQEKPITLRYP